MSTSSAITTRKTRSNHVTPNCIDGSTILDEFHANLHSPTHFIHIFNQYYQLPTHRSTLINILCNILISEDVDRKILLFILDCLITNPEYVSEIQFKQDLLPLLKKLLNKKDDQNDITLSIIRLLTVLVESRSNILTFTLAEWLSCLLNFLATHISSTTYLIYGDLVIDLFSKIVKQFTPISKEIVEILCRSAASILSTNFLNQLKSWIQNADDIRLALFTIHLWESLTSLFSRLIIRGHAKGNEILAVIEDAFTVSNYSIRSTAFTTWSSFMSHIHRLDDVDHQQLNNRLLKLFITPFLSDYTSKSKSASISKCHAWITLISIYPKNVHDVILPFLSFAFGNHLSSKTNSTTTAWWSECRQIGGQFLHELLVNNAHCEHILTIAGDQILNYLFDSIVDQLFDYTINSIKNDDSASWLVSWNAYLNHLINIFKSNNSIHEKQRVAINTCLLTRIEQLWIDSRIETRFLLKLFETFEQIGFPLAIETVLRDSSIRTKTLSAAQIHPSSNNHRSQDKSTSYCTTLSDQYLHMMIEHAIRFNDEDQTIEEAYLHVISYLIDTLSKTSDENFCYQTSSLLLKCSVELSHQPITIPFLFWHIWFRCSTHLINILNRSHTFELKNKSDNQKQETSVELLLRPFSFNDIQRLDYSYTLLWTQSFKALCRLALINNDPTKNHVITLLVELLRNEPAFEQAISDQHNQRLFGFILSVVKTILKTYSDIVVSGVLDRSTNNNFVYLFSNTQKRSLPTSSIVLCFTQLSIIINHILQRLLSSNENDTQYMLVCCCLFKSNKFSTNEQSKSFVFTYIRDLIVDLLGICKIYSHVEMVFKNLTQFIPFIHLYDQTINTNLPAGSSPLTINKQQSDNMIINKVLSIISSVHEPTNSSSLLQLMYPLLILAFHHNKTIVRNKARKCWNETFGRMTFIVYPNELRACLRDLKEKEHLLLPCFLADHDNSNTAGSTAPPSSNDESQLSQIDIPTPLIPQMQINQQPPPPKPSSPARFSSPSRAPTRSTNIDKSEPVFVPIVNNINLSNQSDAPVLISKRSASNKPCLTEKQKEKLRKRQIIPLLCDDMGNTQSSSCTIDTPSLENRLIKQEFQDLNFENKQITTSISFFKQTISNPIQEMNSSVEPSAEKSNEIEKNDENVPEESSIAKKLRRSRRSSISARKSLVDKAKKKRSIPLTDELTVATAVNSSTTMDTPIEQIKKHPIKSILKRLSPTKPRQDHTRRVVFHDQVKVLVFASPSRRDLLTQPKKKSPNRDDTKSPTRIIPKENLPLRKQSPSIRRLQEMNLTEQIVVTSPANTNKTRSSKLFHPNDALADWTSTHQIQQLRESTDEKDSTVSSKTNIHDAICPNLIDCDKSVDSLISLLYDDMCPKNVLDYLHSINKTTVGDIARSTSTQIETYPFPSPKLANIQKAFSLYQENLMKSSSGSPPIDNTNECPMPVASTSEEIMQDLENVSTMESSPPSMPMSTNQHDKLYDVDTLIDSLDYEKLYLNDETPSSTTETSFIRTRHQISTVNRQEIMSLTNEHVSSTITLGDRLQKAADVYRVKSTLPFDDDYIELVRQLFNNSSLTHLERLHLKTLLLDQ